VSNPAFDEVLAAMRATHESKGHDYAEADNPYSNFEFAAMVAGITVDQVFDTLIGIKIARLKVLGTAKEPKHESLADTRKDLAVYAALKASYPIWKSGQGTSDTLPPDFFASSAGPFCRGGRDGECCRPPGHDGEHAAVCFKSMKCGKIGGHAGPCDTSWRTR
jgi:hypothetical protein